MRSYAKICKFVFCTFTIVLFVHKMFFCLRTCFYKCVSSLQASGTRWNFACGAQRDERRPLKTSAAASLSRSRDPQTQGDIHTGCWQQLTVRTVYPYAEGKRLEKVVPPVIILEKTIRSCYFFPYTTSVLIQVTPRNITVRVGLGCHESRHPASAAVHSWTHAVHKHTP